MEPILKARAIRADTGLGKHDIATSSKADYVEKLWNAYIKDGELYLAYSNKVDNVPTNWIAYDFPPFFAVSCAIECNGVWTKQSTGERFYRLDTDAVPWVFWVTPTGTLYTCRADQPDNRLILDENVLNVSAVRGFGSPLEYTLDQGLIAAYVKDNNIAYYKNYCRQADGSYAWEGGSDIPLPVPVDRVVGFRGNDYRVGFIGTSGSTINMIMAQRSWLGMALFPHQISSGITDVSMSVLPIDYHKGENTEHINVSIDTEFNMAEFIEPVLVSAHNPDKSETNIMLTFSHVLTNPISVFLDCISIEDTAWPYLLEDVHATANPFEALLEVQTFGGSSGDLTISYNNANEDLYVIHQGSKFIVPSFSYTFTPDIEPPEGYTADALVATCVDVTFNVIGVDWHSTLNEENIVTNISDMVFTVTQVGSNPL